MFSLLWSAIIGVIASGIAKLIMPDKNREDFFVTMLIRIPRISFILISRKKQSAGIQKVKEPDLLHQSSVQLFCTEFTD